MTNFFNPGEEITDTELIRFLEQEFRITFRDFSNPDGEVNGFSITSATPEETHFCDIEVSGMRLRFFRGVLNLGRDGQRLPREIKLHVKTRVVPGMDFKKCFDVVFVGHWSDDCKDYWWKVESV